jgi:hypothetical protein
VNWLIGTLLIGLTQSRTSCSNGETSGVGLDLFFVLNGNGRFEFDRSSSTKTSLSINNMTF